MPELLRIECWCSKDSWWKRLVAANFWDNFSCIFTVRLTQIHWWVGWCSSMHNKFLSEYLRLTLIPMVIWPGLLKNDQATKLAWRILFNRVPLATEPGSSKALTFDNELLPLQNNFGFLWSLHHHCKGRAARLPPDNQWLSASFQPVCWDRSSRVIRWDSTARMIHVRTNHHKSLSQP